MPDIWLGRFSRWVEKFFNVKGGPSLLDLSPSVMPTLALDRGVDHRYLEGWNRFGNNAVVAAVAASFGNIKLRNPVGSNVMVVIERLLWYAAGDSPQMGWGTTTTDLTTIIVNTFSRFDPRGNPQPTLIFSSQSTATVFTGPVIQIPAGNTGATQAEFVTSLNTEIPIIPGNAIQLQSVVANIAVNASVIWRERPMETSELT